MFNRKNNTTLRKLSVCDDANHTRCGSNQAKLGENKPSRLLVSDTNEN